MFALTGRYFRLTAETNAIKGKLTKAEERIVSDESALVHKELLAIRAELKKHRLDHGC